MRRRNGGLDRIGLATLAKQRTLIETSVVRLHRVGLDQAVGMVADVIRSLSQTARVGGKRAVHHLHLNIGAYGLPRW